MLTNIGVFLYLRFFSILSFLPFQSIHVHEFTSILSARIISSLEPLTGEDRTNVFVIDDSTFERNRSHKVEMLTRIYDHAKHAYRFGFRMLTLGWTDGNTFLPVNSILLSSPNSKSRITQAHSLDKRSSGYKRRCLAICKATDAMLELLHVAKASAIYSRNQKRRGRSKYLLSVLVEVRKGEEIIRLYGKRWNIEVFFKVCKSYLRLSKECRCLSYDSMTAHTAVVFTRYMMLAVENRQSRDLRTLGKIFFYVCDELSDLTWTEGLQLCAS